MKRLLLILLLTSCLSPRQQWVKSLKIVQTELTAIETEAPEVKPRVAIIRNELTKVDEVIEQVVEAKGPSFYEVWSPWFLLIAGLGIAYFGIKTPDPWDTPLGLFMCGLSFVVAKFFTGLAVGVSCVILIYLIYIGAKYLASKGTNGKE